MARMNQSLCFLTFLLCMALCSGSEDSFRAGEKRNVPSTYCVANTLAGNDALQKALDFACGQPGVNCNAIQPGGPCFNPNSVASHASYAINFFFKAHGAQRPFCLANVGLLTTSNPSYGSCIYP